MFYDQFSTEKKATNVAIEYQEKTGYLRESLEYMEESIENLEYLFSNCKIKFLQR